MARQKLADSTTDLAQIRVPSELAARIAKFAEDTGATLAEGRRELYERGLIAAANPVEPRARQRAPKAEAGPNPAGATRVKDRRPVPSSPASSHEVTPIPKASWK